MNVAGRLQFSVIIPTYRRMSVVVGTVAALNRQAHRDFEVIVVVDGSDDGTAAALRHLSTSFPLTVLEQPNQGAAGARNAGAAAAGGDILLFLDDDMEADAALLLEHERSHGAGADIVLGDLPVHHASPPSVLIPGLVRWAERRRARLNTPGVEVEPFAILTGQLSISRANFHRIGGFDVSFTRHGMFGGEDVDFGQRAQRAGLRVMFNPAAISAQYYDVDPALYTRRSREAGRAALELSVKYPERVLQFCPRREFTTMAGRLILGALASAPGPVTWPVRALAGRLVTRPQPDRWSKALFFEVQTMEEKRGWREASRRSRAESFVVLAYHAIADLGTDPVLAEYGVPRERFAAQLDALAEHGRCFIGLDAALQAIDGWPLLPPGGTLVTFDDAYLDLLTDAWPALSARGIPAVVFAVSDRIGGTNEWDRHLGAQVRPLLDEHGLLEIAAHGVAVGSHGATHRPLVGLARSELERELVGSAGRLRALGLPRPTAFSYPYGRWDREAAAAVGHAGYSAAFTVTPGSVCKGAHRYALPRIEVFASDTPRMLRLKVRTATWPGPVRSRILRLARAVGLRWR